jgi:hypothetical protein
MSHQDLSEKSLRRVVDESKRLVAERGDPVAINPTHIMMTGEALAVAKEIMAERGFTTLVSSC